MRIERLLGDQKKHRKKMLFPAQPRAFAMAVRAAAAVFSVIRAARAAPMVRSVDLKGLLHSVSFRRLCLLIRQAAARAVAGGDASPCAGFRNAAEHRFLQRNAQPQKAHQIRRFPGELDIRHRAAAEKGGADGVRRLGGFPGRPSVFPAGTVR